MFFFFMMELKKKKDCGYLIQTEPRQGCGSTI